MPAPLPSRRKARKGEAGAACSRAERLHPGTRWVSTAGGCVRAVWAGSSHALGDFNRVVSG